MLATNDAEKILLNLIYSDRPLEFLPVFYNLAGSIEGAILLHEGIRKSLENPESNGWFPRTYKEWQGSICLSKSQVSRQVSIFKDRQLVETVVKKNEGTPMLHYRFDIHELALQLQEDLRDHHCLETRSPIDFEEPIF